jgi:hypothetical protein
MSVFIAEKISLLNDKEIKMLREATKAKENMYHGLTQSRQPKVL